LGLPVLQRQHARPQQRGRSGKAAEALPHGDDASSFLDSWTALPRLLDGVFTPFADIEESDDSYTLSIDLPGVKKSDVELSVSGRRITVSGHRKDTERFGILRRRTRSVGEFGYDVLLPGEIDDDHVEAKMDAGVLTVRVPKAASEQRRRIPVN